MRSRVFRLLTVLLAALQLAVPPLASVAEARLEAESMQRLRGSAHIESHGSAQCPRVHAASECAVCQFLSATAEPRATQRTLFTNVTRQAALSVEHRDALAALASAPSLPRAPPA